MLKNTIQYTITLLSLFFFFSYEITYEKIENIDTDNSKFKSYIEIINRYQKIFEKIVDNSGKYFNEKIIEANKIDIPDFIRYTEIGKYQGKKSLLKLK